MKTSPSSNSPGGYIGRLQTDADRERVVDGPTMAGSKAKNKAIEAPIQRMAPR